MELLQPRRDFSHLCCIFFVLVRGLIDAGLKDGQSGSMVFVSVGCNCSYGASDWARVDTFSSEYVTGTKKGPHSCYIFQGLKSTCLLRCYRNAFLQPTEVEGEDWPTMAAIYSKSRGLGNISQSDLHLFTRKKKKRPKI